MSFFDDLRHTPDTTKPPGTAEIGDDPLVNLSAVQSRMDSLQKFLSDSVNSNTLLAQHHINMVSNELTNAIHQIIVNGAALISSTQSNQKSTHKRSFSELDKKVEVQQRKDGAINNSNIPNVIPQVESGENEDDWEIIELDAVELLAEHIHFCDYCGKGFKRDANLRMHMRAHGNQYKTPEALAKPEKEMGSGSGSGSRKLRFSCPFVGCSRNKGHNKFRPLKSVICVKNHFKRSHCPKMYTCTRCNKKSFSVLADLKSHSKHCGEVKWKCSCGTHFSRKDKLFGHMALFEGHMPAVEEEQEEDNMIMMKDLEFDVGTGSDNGSDNGFLDRLMIDGFESIDNYCFQDLLESSSSPPNGSLSFF